ncbi:endonuclease/exonuclease/phosphatase family protein [uncultured Maribacter sp.]|uniref:endonuclease/exonuclease/phosphatase family protein n=1 Tax=uncultured Maribacter sp. TaxID=431308 RepID=UPI0030EB581B
MKAITPSFILMFLLFCAFHTTVNAQSKLKVMTYNIWNGFDWGKDASRKTETMLWIKSKNPDVLALQELCGYDEEKLRKDAMNWGHPYVKILKTDGYPVGLTSKKPIDLKERVLDGMSHGALHCKTFGIDFFVVHLSPSDCNIRLKEARIITERVKNSTSEKYILLGDFNSHSPFDEYFLEKKGLLKTAYENQKLGEKRSNLRLGEFDYAVMSTFLALPAIDVALDFSNPKSRYTYPCPASEEVEKKNERIDYILTSASLAKLCTKTTIFNGKETARLSDHYPVMAEFEYVDLE